MDLVRAGTPPALESPVDAATFRTLKRLHPDDSGESVNLGAKVMERALRLEIIKRDQKALEQERRDIEAKIMDSLGDATEGVFGSTGISCSWKTQERKESTRTIAASKYRVLRFRGVKEYVDNMEYGDG